MDRFANGVVAIGRRAMAVSTAGMAMAVSPVTGSAVADPPATQVITVVAEPINGYHEAPSPGNVTAVTDCNTPSPPAVSDDIYSCSPSAADAGTCWPSTAGSLLCVDDPWDQRVHRVDYGGQLPQVAPPAVQDPFALVLDDGTRCQLRNGGAWGGRDDGYVGVYGCGGTSSNLAVLWLPSQGPGTCLDRSSPTWTVKVGQLGAPSEHFPPPQTRAVTTVWFAGNATPA